MAARGLLVVLFSAGVVLGGCMQSTIEPASEANLTPRDKKLLAAAPYEKATIAEPFLECQVAYFKPDEVEAARDWLLWPEGAADVI